MEEINLTLDENLKRHHESIKMTEAIKGCEDKVVYGILEILNGHTKKDRNLNQTRNNGPRSCERHKIMVLCLSDAL